MLNEKPVLAYKKHLVAFLDVLGFREMIGRGALEKIESYLKASEFTQKTLPNLPFWEMKMITFSDSIVLFVDVSHLGKIQQATAATSSFLTTVSNMQLFLARHDIWLRGGVAVGDLFFDEKNRIVFGPSFIEAYDLESKHAKFPRVLVSQKLVGDLQCGSPGELIAKMNKMTATPVLFPWREGLSSNSSFQKDYPLFINYLAYLPKPENKALLETIVDHLVTASQASANTYEKYKWVADYLSILKMAENRIGPTMDEMVCDKIDQLLNSI